MWAMQYICFWCYVDTLHMYIIGVGLLTVALRVDSQLLFY